MSDDLISRKETSPSGLYMASKEEFIGMINDYTEEQIKIVKSGGVAND